MRLSYFTLKAIHSLRDSLRISLITSITLATALVLVGAYVLTLQNLEKFSLVWGRSASITAYLEDESAPAQWASTQHSLETLAAIKSTTLVKPEEALERFRQRGPQAASLVAGVSSDILPASIHVELKGAFGDLKQIEEVSQVIATVPGVADVDYGKEEFERLAQFIEVLRYGGGVAGILLALATILIVSNTIRLTVYSRRDEIAILRLVGATPGFIRMPFIIEGAVWGLLGGSMTWAGFWLTDVLLAPHLMLWTSDVLGGLFIHLYEPTLCLTLLIVGLVLGGVGSNHAVNRFLLREGAS
ncbi:MAG: permease-like cell division protein FtsX [Myxococcota bacterium]|nr:permease-like cell division protein FtsX [Myxococcota bacterium]